MRTISVMKTVDVNVDVDMEDVLEELDDKNLEEELDRRQKRSGRASANADLANDLRLAFYARDASRFEALLVRHLDPQMFVMPTTAPIMEFRKAATP